MSRFPWWVGVALCVGCSGDDGEEPPQQPTVRFEDALHTVEITANSGSVTVAAAQGSAVEVDFTPDAASDDWQNSIIDGTLVMGAICGDGTPGCGGSFEVRTPPNHDLDILTTSGAISMRGNLGGRITVVSESGTIEGVDLGAADLATHTIDNGTNLSFQVPPAHLDVLGGGSGGIGVTVPAGEYQIEVSTIGSITIEGGVVDGNLGPELLLESGSGNVIVSAR